MKYCVFVMGPAAAGKSTLCALLQEHMRIIRRSNVHVINLDPAAEQFRYDVSIDVQELITVDDVQEEMYLGPNGALMFCYDYLLSHGQQWIADQVGDYADDFVIIDCPG